MIDGINSCFCHADGREIAVIERNPVSVGSLGAEEIAEFVEEAGSLNPPSGSR